MAKRPALVSAGPLDVLAPTGPGPRLRDAFQIPLAQIDPNPDQPRRLADADRLAELAADIAERGVLEPLLVRPTEGGRYQVVAGGRRLAAAAIAGLDSVPCLVRSDLDDEEARAVALVENLQREDLDPEDEGRAFAALQEQGWSQRKIAGAIHKSHQYVMRRLQLIDNPAALEAWRAGLVDLTELLAVDPAPPVATLADAAQTAADQLLQAGENGPVRTTPPRPPVIDPALAEWHVRVFKPLVKIPQYTQRVDPEAIPPDERGRFRQAIGEAIDALAELVRAIPYE